MSNPVGAATEIRPFRIELPDEAVEDLLRRLAATGPRSSHCADRRTHQRRSA